MAAGLRRDAARADIRRLHHGIRMTDECTEPLQVYLGFDSRAPNAYRVCEASLRRHASIALEVHPLSLAELRAARLYRRVHQERDGRLWDVISNAPMSTEFTLTRFLVPHLARYQGWAIYCDCDFLWRADVAELMCFADPQYACMVVKHRYLPQQGEKMRGQWNVIY